jgi:glycosyltransferase involved in cell wall biosynthesis
VAWRLKERLAVRAATRLFTVSQASRRALMRTLGDSREIAVVPEAPDPVFRQLAAGEPERDLTEVGLEPGEPFLLCAAGGISPHKNVEALLGAVAALDGAPRLVVCGALDDEVYASSAVAVRARIDALGLRDRVLLPGFVSDELLAALCRRATLVVSPSLAEGYGLPVVEAAACGAAVVLSDLEAHRETLGGAGVFFDPRDTGDLTGVLAGLLDDEARRVAVAHACRAAVAGITWDAAGERLSRLVRVAVETGRG